MDSPKRIQRKRTKGWRMPAGAVYVGRPSRWGNPWRVIPSRWGSAWAVVSGVVGRNATYLGDFGSPEAAAYWAVQGYRRDGAGIDGSYRDIATLRGRDLACWCPLDQPCHADVLLELANG